MQNKGFFSSKNAICHSLILYLILLGKGINTVLIHTRWQELFWSRGTFKAQEFSGKIPGHLKALLQVTHGVWCMTSIPRKHGL